jgi:hypothetical protein
MKVPVETLTLIVGRAQSKQVGRRSVLIWRVMRLLRA